MSSSWAVFCDEADLAVDLARLAATTGVGIEPIVEASPLPHAARAAEMGRPTACAVCALPREEELVAYALRARAGTGRAALAVLESTDDRYWPRAVALDLGVPAVAEVRPLLALLALLDAGVDASTGLATRGLSRVDQRRLAGCLEPAGRSGPRLVRDDEGMLALETPRGRYRIGEPRDVLAALEALRAASPPWATPEARPSLEPAARRAAHEVLFGPPRRLSDPASKNALAPYGVPLPVEELVTSPSRAASEAARIGFPVRLALASPDLRIWDHPDLAVDGVEGPTRVREAFRQLHELAARHDPTARILGVTVGASMPARALLRIGAVPLPEGLVLARIGFADPHGLAADDCTDAVLPAAPERIERVLGRLRGHRLLLGPRTEERRETCNALAGVLGRIAAFVDEQRPHVEGVEIDPLVLRADGTFEVREAAVRIGDAFMRALQATGR
ncbi:MAG: acetate--CoA ligase family protein [Myxococcota bacterium]|nr:acetate--CoA ligase family protein [Myxococcota bacterium]MDW8362771.1 acetate--CoA ligase family protein [Myxococcales bacterium]